MTTTSLPTAASDSSVILASGDAGPVDLDAFEVALDAVCLDLTKQIVNRDEEVLIVLGDTIAEYNVFLSTRPFATLYFSKSPSIK